MSRNRLYYYTYCLNNPLIYTDPDGEFAWHIVIGAGVGGIMNLAYNWDNVDNFWDGLGYFAVGAAAGATSAAIGGSGGLTAIQTATLGGTTYGAISYGGNVAIQGGSAEDIYAGVAGGAALGGTMGMMGGAAIAELGNLASNIPANWYGDAHSNGWLYQSNQPITLMDVFNNLNYSVNGLFSDIGSGGMGAGNLFQFANISSSPVNLRTSTNPIGDIFQRVHYLNSVGDGLKYDYLSDIVLQNGYGNTGNAYGANYSKIVNVNGADYSLRVAVRHYNINDQDRYQVFDAGFGYLDRFTNYPFSTMHNGGYHSGFFITGYEENYLITIGAKNKRNYRQLKRLFMLYER